jgi:hypothetical protein
MFGIGVPLSIRARARGYNSQCGLHAVREEFLSRSERTTLPWARAL